MKMDEAKRRLAQARSTFGKKAVRDVLKAGLKKARANSKGTVTYAQMRKEDHPYAKRHAFNLHPLEIINYHEGNFYRGWMSYESTSNLGRISGKVINDSEVANYMRDGTKYMKLRPIKQAVEEEMEFSALEAEIKMANAIEQRFL